MATTPGREPDDLVRRCESWAAGKGLAERLLGCPTRRVAGARAAGGLLYRCSLHLKVLTALRVTPITEW